MGSLPFFEFIPVRLKLAHMYTTLPDKVEKVPFGAFWPMLGAALDLDADFEPFTTIRATIAAIMRMLTVNPEI